MTGRTFDICGRLRTLFQLDWHLALIPLTEKKLSVATFPSHTFPHFSRVIPDFWTLIAVHNDLLPQSFLKEASAFEFLRKVRAAGKGKGACIKNETEPCVATLLRALESVGGSGPSLTAAASLASHTRVPRCCRC